MQTSRKDTNFLSYMQIFLTFIFNLFLEAIPMQYLCNTYAIPMQVVGNHSPLILLSARFWVDTNEKSYLPHCGNEGLSLFVF